MKILICLIVFFIIQQVFGQDLVSIDSCRNPLIICPYPKIMLEVIDYKNGCPYRATCMDSIEDCRKQGCISCNKTLYEGEACTFKCTKRPESTCESDIKGLTTPCPNGTVLQAIVVDDKCIVGKCLPMEKCAVSACEYCQKLVTDGRSCVPLCNPKLPPITGPLPPILNALK